MNHPARIGLPARTVSPETALNTVQPWLGCFICGEGVAKEERVRIRKSRERMISFIVGKKS